jgi:hypothetical protein
MKHTHIIPINLNSIDPFIFQTIKYIKSQLNEVHWASVKHARRVPIQPGLIHLEVFWLAPLEQMKFNDFRIRSTIKTLENKLNLGQDATGQYRQYFQTVKIKVISEYEYFCLYPNLSHLGFKDGRVFYDRYSVVDFKDSSEFEWKHFVVPSLWPFFSSY